MVSLSRFSRVFLLLVSLLGLKTIMVNCTKDKSKEPEKVLDEAYCNNLKISFKDDVSPLIVKNCASSSCHSTKTKAGDFILETYDEMKEAGESGILSCVVNHGSGCEPMPEGRKKLTTDKLEIIDCWILLGMPNN